MQRQSSETAQNMILDEVAPQFVPGRRPRVSPPPIEASKLGVNVIEPAITMAKLHEDLQRSLHEAAMLLSEINEHSLIVVDTDVEADGRGAGVGDVVGDFSPLAKVEGGGRAEE